MGMFDYIRADYPLPFTLEMVDWDLDIQEMPFQTKDLENFMEEYFINPEGELYYVKHTREWVDDDNAFLKGYLKIVDTEIVPANFHGVVYFYCYEDLPEKDGKHYSFYAEYEAKFSNNKLVSLELFDYKIEDNTEYKLDNKRFFDELEKKNNKWYNKYIFRTTPVRKVRHWIYRFFYHLHNLTGKMHTFVIRHF